MIPKIIHQTWKGPPDTLLTQWVDSHHTWTRLAQEYGFTYMYWDDQAIDQFIATHFPWFLSKFRAYTYGIQRADTFRYFVLYHYGGIYSDFDNVPTKEFFTELYPKLQNEQLVLGICKKDSDVGTQNLTNAFMWSIPEHSFWVHVWYLLYTPFKYNPYKSVLQRIYYFHVLFTTGPGIISDAYHSLPNHKKYRIHLSPLLQTLDGPYIHTITGNSWHKDSTSASVITFFNRTIRPPSILTK
jgi:mannosyltransferase OCH1-like enzyme